jgi:hypothetical protein
MKTKINCRGREVGHSTLKCLKFFEFKHCSKKGSFVSNGQEKLEPLLLAHMRH